jgi:hypothetical protein
MIASAMSAELEYTNLCYTNDMFAHTAFRWNRPFTFHSRKCSCLGVFDECATCRQLQLCSCVVTQRK